MAEIDDSTSSLRTCRRCGEAKALTASPKAKDCAAGRAATCSACRASLRTPESRARSDQKALEWRRANPGRWREIRQKQDERARRRAGRREADLVAAEFEAKRVAAVRTKTLRRSEAKAALLAAKPWNDPALTKAQAFVLRYKLDPAFNISQRLRAAERRRQRGIRVAECMRDALNRGGESSRVYDLLGYTIADLRRHLGRQFTSGMTWGAFLEGRIHIDHRRPLSSFDLSDEGQWLEAWCLTNLQPLWAKDNLVKRAKRELLL